MRKKINLVLKDALEKVNPTEETINYITEEVNNFKKSIKKRIDKLNIDVEIFVGGSFAKKTVVKKGSYDADIFLRFNKKYKNSDLSILTKKILKKTKKVSRVHGSRDYFKVKICPWFYLEIVPVIKVKNPKESENITDLSASHVKFINKKIKSEKILNDIKLAKAFCDSTKTYGAESYVNGFSGYSLELLIYHYKSFTKLLKELSKDKNEKIIIDTEKLYKNKKNILIELNGSKLSSPIVLIDPTFKDRNAAAALSEETFSRFKAAAKKFLLNPTLENFFPKKIDLDELKKIAKKNKEEFVLVSIKTKKQEGDIAGTKLLKFHRHLTFELKKYFVVKKSGFKYLKKREGKSYFVLKKKNEIIYSGPLKSDISNTIKFKKVHKKTYVKDKRLYSKKKLDFTIKEFFKNWKKENKKKIKQMYITKIKIL